MTHIFSRFFRTVFFLILAVIGTAAALLFVIATMMAVAIFYTIAKVRGQRFSARAYWNQRYKARRGPLQKSSTRAKQQAKDVIDVQVRELR
jgi:hypothetical protein